MMDGHIRPLSGTILAHFDVFRSQLIRPRPSPNPYRLQVLRLSEYRVHAT